MCSLGAASGSSFTCLQLLRLGRDWALCPCLWAARMPECLHAMQWIWQTHTQGERASRTGAPCASQGAMTAIDKQRTGWT